MEMFNQDELKALMEAANKAEAEGKLGTSEFKDLPDGEYYAVIEDAAPGKTKDAGVPKVELKLRVSEGDYKNRLHWTRYVFYPTGKGGQINIKNIDKLAKEFGIIHEPSSITDYPMEDVVEAFIGREVRFRIKTKGEYTNTYVNAC